MSTTTFRNTKLYHKLSERDINRTDISSREDRYQDAVLDNLEKKAKKRKRKKKSNESVLQS